MTDEYFQFLFREMNGFIEDLEEDVEMRKDVQMFISKEAVNEHLKQYKSGEHNIDIVELIEDLEIS